MICKILVYLFYFFNYCNSVLRCKTYEYGVNQQEKNYIVNTHNQLRLQIAKGTLPGQPKGINLKRMQWDDYLAGQAQNIANTCIYGHVRVQDARFGVGQNIAASWSTEYSKGSNWSFPVNSWWDEYKLYRYPNGFSNAVGHYTQMAWATTQYVGCGYTYFPVDNKPPFKYEKYYVCNYGPAGNSGGPPYKSGSSGCENLC